MANDQVEVTDNWLDDNKTPKSAGGSFLITEKARFTVKVRKEWAAEIELKESLQDPYGNKISNYRQELR